MEGLPMCEHELLHEQSLCVVSVFSEGVPTPG